MKEILKMAKRRRVVGSIVKGKDGKTDYIKVLNEITLKKGQFLNLESKQAAQTQLNKSVSEGKLSGELVEKIQKSIDNTPEWVRFNIIMLEDKE